MCGGFRELLLRTLYIIKTPCVRGLGTGLPYIIGCTSRAVSSINGLGNKSMYSQTLQQYKRGPRSLQLQYISNNNQAILTRTWLTLRNLRLSGLTYARTSKLMLTSFPGGLGPLRNSSTQDRKSTRATRPTAPGGLRPGRTGDGLQCWNQA